jgi:hypothetical protein
MIIIGSISIERIAALHKLAQMVRIRPRSQLLVGAVMLSGPPPPSRGSATDPGDLEGGAR